ncbi:probable ATP-dependent helicase PF08_0048 [Venturia canescens]|uniref:probable ATP-dependent helicase PF08_0048 n=1 Tax=Venturia canescens TaxID=32260 RepID=UPI001C9D141D|nr:probable ATP-dependent helicase PF08_0048 [Venturia canescens]
MFAFEVIDLTNEDVYEREIEVIDLEPNESTSADSVSDGDCVHNEIHIADEERDANCVMSDETEDDLSLYEGPFEFPDSERVASLNYEIGVDEVEIVDFVSNDGSDEEEVMVIDISDNEGDEVSVDNDVGGERDNMIINISDDDDDDDDDGGNINNQDNNVRNNGDDIDELNDEDVNNILDETERDFAYYERDVEFHQIEQRKLIRRMKALSRIPPSMRGNQLNGG